MASPAQQWADILQQAISNAIQENKDVFTETVNVQGGGTSAPGGGGTGDFIGTILGLAGLGLLAGPAVDVVIEALDAVQSAGGSNGISFSVGYFLASTGLSFAEPYTRILTHLIENEAQSQIFDPATAAELSARGIIQPAFGQSEAGGGGFDKTHWDGLLTAAYNYPSVPQIFAMWNRGYIDQNQATALMQLNGIAPQWLDDVQRLHQEILTPADYALAVLRENITLAVGQAGAAQWGLSEDDFNTLMLNTGEPPGAEQLMEALRRGYIDDATFQEGIRQSRIRNQWIDTMTQLRYSPMSVAQAANAVVRGYITPEQGADIAQQDGLLPAHWPLVLEANGRPPSHEQMATLWLRGKVDLPTFQQAIRESDIKNKYIQDIIDLSVRLLPLFEGNSLLKSGEITGATFSQQMLDQGYQKPIIDEIVKAVGTGKHTTAKHLTQADYTELYNAAVLTRQQAQDGLVSIGYTVSDADSILTVADVKAQAKIITTLVSNVRAQFDRYKIDATQAGNELKALDLPDAEVDTLVKTWTITRPTGTRQPTEAQIIKFFKTGNIDEANAITRLQGLGYDIGDATMLIQAYG